MTGLVPAMARFLGIPCLFSLYRLEGPRLLLAVIEDRGIDAALFWQNCYYERMPANYEETRNTNPLDLMISGVFAAHTVVALEETMANVLADGGSQRSSAGLGRELLAKRKAGRLLMALPSLDPSFNPADDPGLMRPYRPENHHAGKLFNKLHLQETLNLAMDSTAPVFIWPTRLDGERPGCRMMADTLAEVLARYRQQGLQVVIVADGDFKGHMHARIESLQAGKRVAVCDFDDRQYRRAYAGADFVLVPLHHDPGMLPCMIGLRYGALPIVYDTGAIQDSVRHLDAVAGIGSGFVFENYDAAGFLWAIDEAMAFYGKPLEVKASQVQRIMADSLVRFDPEYTIQRTIGLYAHVLARPMADLRAMSDPGLSPRRAA
jgi:glycogen synthase